MLPFKADEWNFDIDQYINTIIPPSPLHKLPTPLSRFLGYRKEQGPDVGNVLGAFWSFVGAFCGLAIVAAVFNNVQMIQAHHPPALIASFGASAILEYNVIRSPLGQPRNALLGHALSALVGVGITKLFLYHSDFTSIRWIAGAVSCGAASALMLLTGTVHPPGGASAVIAATSPEVTAMGWYFVGLVMLGTTLMLGIGLLINNIHRQFPVYWWTPLDVRRTRRRNEQVAPDARGGFEFRGEKESESEVDEEDVESKDGDVNLETGKGGKANNGIFISSQGVSLPTGLALNSQEAELLERLKMRLVGLQVVKRNGRDSEETKEH
ncbi:unnamed protein product [Periconia digitata]|uniref:HPP transmembrane region domain-containing protein n=1 Tax=Periconia digitata TaxID=1303443 RepID=A0A9W4XJM7_9PLEO|nr:unnamed protein product [Periconia digitata]